MTFTNETPTVTVIPQRGGKTQWLLEEDYYFHWEHKGQWYRFIIPAGFQFDGASVPWFLRWIAGRGRFGVLAPLVHDWLIENQGWVTVEAFGRAEMWQMIGRTQFERRDADRLFFRILREQGVKPRWLRRWAFRMVRLWSLLKGDRY